MTFANVLENLSIVGVQSRQWDSCMDCNDAEEAQNWGNQIAIESTQPSPFTVYLMLHSCYFGVITVTLWDVVYGLCAIGYW